MAEELYEMEYTDDDIVYYIDDEAGNEIGFAVMEDGKEVEYYYADDVDGGSVVEAVDTVLGAAHKMVDENPFVSREDVADLGRNLNAIAKENAATMEAMREIGNDFKEFADFFRHPFKPVEKPKEEAAEEKPKPVEAPPKLAPKPVVVIEEE